MTAGFVMAESYCFLMICWLNMPVLSYLSVEQTFIQLLSEFIKLIFWMNDSCGLPNVAAFVGTPTSYTGLGFRSHPGYQLFSMHEIGIYMAGAVNIVVPIYWTTHNFISQTTTIKILWLGFLWFSWSPISRCHDSLVYYATLFMICPILAIENIIKETKNQLQNKIKCSNITFGNGFT